MYDQMIRLSLSTTPSLGAITGGSFSQSLLNRINEEAAMDAGGVRFGDPNDPLANNYNNFMQHIWAPAAQANVQMIEIKQEYLDVDIDIYPINNVNQLVYVSNSMRHVILQDERIRKYHKENRIDAWGIKPEEVADNDPIGRIAVRNGLIDDFINQKEFVIEWQFDENEPDYTFIEADMVDTTRDFIGKFLKEYENKDITNFPEEIKTVKPKKVK